MYDSYENREEEWGVFLRICQKWRELATQVQPPTMENGMIKWFIDNLKPPYYEKMIST